MNLPRKPISSRHAFWLLCALALAMPAAVFAPPPAWWTDRNATNGNTPDNYAAANIGQLTPRCCKPLVRLCANHSFDFGWFYDQVKNKGPWDYKQCDKNSYANQAFGNFNYGSAGSAMFIPPEFLRRMAGWAQGPAGTSKPEWGDPGMFIGRYPVPGTGHAPYGDDPDDQFWIKGGMQYYNQVTHPRR